MSVVLKNQIEASERSAGELELRIAHQQAMVSLDVEALMDSVVEIFVELGRYVERWQDQPLAADQLGLEAGETELFDLYLRLDRTFLRASQLGRAVESWGFVFHRKSRFKNIWRKLKGIVSVTPDRVAESLAQIRRGEGRLLGDISDELSGRP